MAGAPMAGVAVVTDSTASLNGDLVSRADLTVIGLKVVVGRTSRPEAGSIEGARAPGTGPGAPIAAEAVAAALRAGTRITTTRPSPDAFAAAYAVLARRGHSAIVSAHLSGEMSGTVRAARQAARQASVPVHVVDTRTIAMAVGFAVLAGARAAAQDVQAERVASIVSQQAAAATVDFVVPSLEHLRRGGRIGAAAARLGTALAVKPLLTVRAGHIIVAERVRTMARAVARLEERALAAWAETASDYDHVDLAVHHVDNVAGAERLAQQLSDQLPSGTSIVISELSPVLAAHVGPDALGLVVAPRY